MSAAQRRQPTGRGRNVTTGPRSGDGVGIVSELNLRMSFGGTEPNMMSDIFGGEAAPTCSVAAARLRVFSPSLPVGWRADAHGYTLSPLRGFIFIMRDQRRQK